MTNVREESIDYLRQYNTVTDKVINTIEKHCKRYGFNFNVCAWYLDWNDFCSDWCDQLGYTKTEARKLLHGGVGEFQIINGFGIVRYTM